MTNPGSTEKQIEPDGLVQHFDDRERPQLISGIDKHHMVFRKLIGLGPRLRDKTNEITFEVEGRTINLFRFIPPRLEAILEFRLDFRHAFINVTNHRQTQLMF